MSVNSRKMLIDSRKVSVSCVVPVFNESEGIKHFLDQLIATLQLITENYEIVLIDDGSSDATIVQIQPFLQQPQIKLIVLSRNFGKEIALTAGLEHSNGDVTILMDADLQHPLNMISVFLDHWSQGYDMVYGVREDRENEAYIKRNFANLFYWIMKKITKIEVPSNAGDFRLMDKMVVSALKIFPERTRFMKGLYAWVGFKRIAVPFKVSNRLAGKSSWHFSRLTELAITGITSFSDVPLRIWGFIGCVISLLSLFYALYIVTVTLLFGADMPGFPTLVVAIMFFGGIQLMSIGILGEYIGRIFTEVKHRPKYIIHSKFGFTDEQE